MALVFPAAPNVGDRFPVDPGTSGVTQYVWDGTTWSVVPPSVSLGVANQAAFNSYVWPAADGSNKQQLQTDGAGNLSWHAQADLDMKPLGVTPPVDGITKVFTLVEYGTTTPFTPSTNNNLIVFVGGVAQLPGTAYTVAGNQITLSTAPESGTDFLAVTAVLAP